MPMVEVDEVELQQSRSLRKLVEGLGNDPRTKRKFAELIKEVNPDAKITVPPPDPAEERFAKLEKELADEKKARAEAEAKRDQEDKLTSIRSKQEAEFSKLRGDKWTDDGLKKVQELMEKEGILSPLVAAAYIEKQNPPPAPVTPNSTGSWNFLEMPQDADANLKAMIESKGENVTLLDKMANEALTDFRGQTRR